MPDDEHTVIVVAGAPSHVCEKNGLFFSDRKGAPPRLWVYFNIDNGLVLPNLVVQAHSTCGFTEDHRRVDIDSQSLTGGLALYAAVAAQTRQEIVGFLAVFR